MSSSARPEGGERPPPAASRAVAGAVSIRKVLQGKHSKGGKGEEGKEKGGVDISKVLQGLPSREHRGRT